MRPHAVDGAADGDARRCLSSILGTSTATTRRCRSRPRRPWSASCRWDAEGRAYGAGSAAARQARLRRRRATVEQGVTAATYTPPRPVAVPADGASHRATIASIDLDTELDYVTAPVRSPDVHLRATVVNSSSTPCPPAGRRLPRSRLRRLDRAAAVGARRGRRAGPRPRRPHPRRAQARTPYRQQGDARIDPPPRGRVRDEDREPHPPRRPGHGPRPVAGGPRPRDHRQADHRIPGARRNHRPRRHHLETRPRPPAPKPRSSSASASTPPSPSTSPAGASSVR